MKRSSVISLGVASAVASGSRVASAQVAPAPSPLSPDDAVAIRTAALDYIEGWYAGDGDRMERALHPELAKRIVFHNDKTGADHLDSMSALTLIHSTRRGGGKRTPLVKQRKDVTILDAFNDAAAVKVVASDWVDYLHVVRSEGRWQIVNVLWSLMA